MLAIAILISSISSYQAHPLFLPMWSPKSFFIGYNAAGLNSKYPIWAVMSADAPPVPDILKTFVPV